MFDKRTKLSAKLLKNLNEKYPNLLSKTVIHNSVQIKEAACMGVPVIKYMNKCKAAEDYKKFADEIILQDIKYLLSMSPDVTEDDMNELISDLYCDMPVSQKNEYEPLDDKDIFEDTLVEKKVILNYHRVMGQELQIAGDFITLTSQISR